MKLSNALTAISCILLLSQTMQQPAFAEYDPSDPNSGGTTDPEDPSDPEDPIDPQEPNTPGPDSGKADRVNPSFDPVGSGDKNPSEQFARNGGNLSFDLRLGYQGLVLLDSCTGEDVITKNICVMQPNVASLPTE